MSEVNKAELRRLAHEATENEFAWLDRTWLSSIMADDWADYVAAANPSAILSLLDECGSVAAERDAALAELEAIKSSGWRNHSVNYARAEKCPQTLETAQAAWDRDQELLEEQRQQIAKDSQTINDLRQKLEAYRNDADRLDLLADLIVIECFVGVDKDIYEFACEVAERNGREEPTEGDQRQAIRLLIDAFRAKECSSNSQNTGHGHVFPRPDGVRMRCGGPGICEVCSRDLSGKEGE